MNDLVFERKIHALGTEFTQGVPLEYCNNLCLQKGPDRHCEAPFSIFACEMCDVSAHSLVMTGRQGR